ncbi:S8 family serine peptidase [Luteimonas sp. TWI1437]|uniref:S8 family serine peptidase n=1 Tax=unclassified Luteimonas TaxID=2629088 RepID=UPI003209795B
MSRIRTLGGASVLLGVVAVAAASTVIPGAEPAARQALQSARQGVGALLGTAPVASAATPRGASPAPAAQGPGRYIVVLDDPALAGYSGGVAGLAAPAKRREGQRLDVRSAPARSYVGYLQRRQREVESGIALDLGRSLRVERRMQHAINGLVVELAPAEAAKVAARSDVRFVEPYREYALDTDTGPGLIGAPALWNGAIGGLGALKGEGVVVGILDSGINFGSPSFSAVDPVDGYVHINPLGSGTYLGTCAPGGIDAGRCNDKLIGGYDFVCEAPGLTCGREGIREEPGFGDTNSHGSHVASTVAGNRRNVVFSGNSRAISGVAPRANIVAFDICYTRLSDGRGLCPNVSAVAAVEQALADGIVDVINYSIGGGGQPWSEAVSLAFLSASEAGIYVAASAGNSGPAANSMGHLEPWVASTGAAQHGRGAFASALQVTGPAPVPEPLSLILLTEGTGGTPHTASIPGTTRLRVSAGIDGGTDGCSAYAAGTFQNAIAVVRRGSCAFSDKAANAAAAGAVAVLIANNAEGGLVPSVPGATVPVFSVTQAEGNALRDFAATRPNATAGIGYPPLATPNVPDALGDFSSRGPAGTFNLLKPDVVAPGVSILATVAGETITGYENALGLMNGTSMASPHHAGAAALLRQARPDWSVPEIKSALALTAKTLVYTEDEVTPGTPFDRGSGRIRVDRAAEAGLLMHETGARYLAANPAQGGDVANLNQPGLANRNCQTRCSFVRTFRNPHAQASTWRVRVAGVTATAMPAQLRVPAGASVSLRITVDARSLPANGSWRFGEVTLEPVGGALGPQRTALTLPVAVARQAN